MSDLWLSLHALPAIVGTVDPAEPPTAPPPTEPTPTATAAACGLTVDVPCFTQSTDYVVPAYGTALVLAVLLLAAILGAQIRRR